MGIDMQDYKVKSKKVYCNYFGPPLTTPKKEPDPFQHHYVRDKAINADFGVLSA